VPTLSFTGSARRSPVEIVATMGTRLTRSPAAEMSGLRTGRFGRWADGVNAMRADCATFAGYWREHNDRVLTEHKPGPLWVVLGDSTAQGLGAPSPACGYVGQSLAALNEKELACATFGEVTRKYPRASLTVKQVVEREQKRVHC